MGTLFRTCNTCAAHTLRSLDGGQTWEGVFENTASHLIQVPDGPFYAVFFDRWARTHDEGATWVEGPVPGPPEAFAVLPGGRLLLSTESEVYRSDDDGLSWEPTAEELPRIPKQFAVDAAGTIFVSLFEGVFRSDDGGATWEVLGFENTYPHGPIVVGPPGIVVAVISDGVFFSLDRGDTWMLGADAVLQDRWPRIEVTSLHVTADGRVIAGTDGMGVFTGALPSTTAAATPQPPPGPSLSAYPNPSRAGTGQVRLERVGGSEIRMVLYDVLGREVARLFEGRADPGDAIPLPANLPAGVYVVQASSDTWHASLKVGIFD